MLTVSVNFFLKFTNFVYRKIQHRADSHLPTRASCAQSPTERPNTHQTKSEHNTPSSAHKTETCGTDCWYFLAEIRMSETSVGTAAGGGAASCRNSRRLPVVQDFVARFSHSIESCHTRCKEYQFYE